MFLALSLVAISSVLDVQLTGISASTAQQVAKGLLDNAMEEVRALPYATVADGLSTSDLQTSSDVGSKSSQNISVSGSTYTFKPTGETIPTASGLSNVAPLVPHQSTTTINAVTFTTSAYVSIPTQITGVTTVPTGLLRLTVIVSWPPGLLAGVDTVSAQTFVYPTTCLASNNNPWDGPCQAFFTADGGAGSGGAITESGSLLGVTLAQVESFFPQSTSSMEVQQTSTVNGCVQTSGGQLQVTGYSSESAPYQTGCSNATNNPGASNTNSASVSEHAASWSWPLALMPLVPVGTDSGTSVSTISASTSQGCDDLSSSPVAQNTSLPCGSGAVTESGANASVAADLASEVVGLTSLGNAPLVSSAPAPSTASFVSQYSASEPSSLYCDNQGVATSGDGCVHAGAQRSFTLELGGLPSGLLSGALALAPAHWGSQNAVQSHCPAGNYLLALVNYSDQVSSESGISASAPTATTNGGGASYLCYYTGSGWSGSALSLPSASSGPQAITINGGNPLTFTNVLNAVSVTIDPNLSLGTYSTSPNSSTTASGCSSNVCSASATITSPISGSFTYAISVAGVQIVNLTVTVNLGQLTASTSYQSSVQEAP